MTTMIDTETLIDRIHELRNDLSLSSKEYEKRRAALEEQWQEWLYDTYAHMYTRDQAKVVYREARSMQSFLDYRRIEETYQYYLDLIDRFLIAKL